MPQYTPNLQLYKWDKTDSKVDTITEMANNAHKIDTKLKDVDESLAQINTDLSNTTSTANDAVQKIEQVQIESAQAVTTSNEAQGIAESANTKSDEAKTLAANAKSTADTAKAQLDEVTKASSIDPQVSQALVGADGKTYTNIGNRFDTVDAHLAQRAEKSDLDLNVKWEGVNETVLDNSPLFGMVIEKLDTGLESKTGGRIKIPRGSYKGHLVIKTTHSSNLASIIIEGEGQQNTIIDGAGLEDGKNGIEIQGGIFVKVRDLQVLNAPANGIAVLGEQSGHTTWSHLEIKDVRSSRNGLSGIYLERGFMASFKDVFATHNGLYGFELKGFHTSLTFKNCYGVNNISDNFFINDVVYSSFINCGSDGAGQFGYKIRNCNTVNFINCGAESCQRSGWGIEASTVIEGDSIINKGTNQVTFDGCFATSNDKGNQGYGNFLYANQSDDSKIKGIKIENCNDHLPSGANSIVVSGANVDIVEDNNRFVGKVNYTNGAERKLVKYPLTLNGVSVTTPNTPIASLSNDYNDHLSNYGGTLIVTARNGVMTNTNANTATYVLLVGKHGAGSNVVEVAKNGVTTGGSANHPSFTFSIDTVNNKLLASPIGATSGVFYFVIETQGLITVKS